LKQELLSKEEEMDRKALKTQLTNALRRPVSERQAELLDAHLASVLEQNKTLNLTSITDVSQGILLHIEDSLAAHIEVDAAPEGRMMDLGSGGGFPGIPLAILTGRKTTLVEATAKKANFLQRFINEQDLGAFLEVVGLRAEEVAQQSPRTISVITARAVSSLPALMELAAPLLIKGGILIAYKGRVTDETLEDALSLEKELGMKVVGVRSFVLSDEVTKRAIVCFEKVGEAGLVLPRRVGQAQRHPLA
jgi:16S rRNA (guanine527-N7)-methyltransferase